MKRLVLENKDSIVNQIRLYFENNSEAKFIHRLQVILLFASMDDKSCDSLGALFGNSPRSVSSWIKKVNKTGTIDSLRSKPGTGRPSRLTDVQKDDVRMVLRELPEKFGFSDKKWNGKNLSSYISGHYGIHLKVRACQRLINELTAII